MINTAVVFCGSSYGNHPAFNETAIRLGGILAQNNIRLIYGGGNVGLMKTIADSVMQQGGKVTGVIPGVLVEREKQHKGIDELIVASDMHERKKQLYSLADIAIVLPGGYGTMDEMFEVTTWNQLVIHHKKMYLLNVNGFYNHLIAHLDVMQQEGFLHQPWDNNIKVINEPAELDNLLNVGENSRL